MLILINLLYSVDHTNKGPGIARERKARAARQLLCLSEDMRCACSCNHSIALTVLTNNSCLTVQLKPTVINS